MTVYGDQGKGEVVWDTATDSKGRSASWNALHTIWDAKFKNKGAHVIHNKDLAILNFALTEVSQSSIMFNLMIKTSPGGRLRPKLSCGSADGATGQCEERSAKNHSEERT